MAQEFEGGKGSGAHCFFRPYRKGGGKGKKSGKADSSSASKANIAEDEVEEEETEDDALLTDKNKKRRCPHPKKKSKSQPASSACDGLVIFEELGPKPPSEWWVAGVAVSWDNTLSPHSQNDALPYPPNSPAPTVSVVEL